LAVRLAQSGLLRDRIDPHAELTDWEDRQWIIQLFESLPLAQREVMAYTLDGFTIGEISEILEKEPAAIRQRLKSARERLKKFLISDERITGHTS